MPPFRGDYVVEQMKSVMKFLKILHWLGLTMVLGGVWLYLGTELTAQVTGMLWASVLLGLGLVLMSPFPVVLVIEWARGQSSS
ncbi:hypothetical protein K0H63_15275 [Shewanella zhangzhouensis]|nr:hypothetical protein K0H79_14420 [Shewanella sp. FJAT-52076]QYK04413.1 hypothetical protein K0H63_15275 [Shewanella zhangzhouensis]